MTANDKTDSSLRHAETRGEGSLLGPVRGLLAHDRHGLPGQFGLGVSASARAPALIDFVGFVVPPSAKPQVLQAHARRVVAGVTHLQAVRNVSYSELPQPPSGCSPSERSVTAPRLGSSPDQATTFLSAAPEEGLLVVSFPHAQSVAGCERGIKFY